MKDCTEDTLYNKNQSNCVNIIKKYDVHTDI